MSESAVFMTPNVRAKGGADGVAPGPGWQKCTGYRRPGPGGTPLALPLSEVVRPHCAGAPAALWHQDLATGDFLLLGSEVRVQLHAVRPVIAAAAVLGQDADRRPAETPRTRKKRCWRWLLAAMRNAPFVGALLPKLLGEHCSVLPRLLGSRSGVSERHPTDLAC
jgi:hypothetical protein